MRSFRVAVGAPAVLSILALSSWVQAQSPSASPPGAVSGAPGAASSAPAPASSAAAAEPAGAGCVERIPEGKARPKMVEKIAGRGTSGHALVLTLVIEHGPGEKVLPSGFHLETTSEGNKALEASHFFVPEERGGAGPKLKRSEAGGRATTTVELSFVPLPDKPGRNQLVLPPLPIAISRASGELMTLCTASHPVTIEEPIANLPDPKPKRNPPPRPQREEWTTAKHVTIAALIALAVGALLAWLISLWLKRPRPVTPAPPPRPPWEVALEALFDIRHSGLLEEHRLAELYDRVSDVVRRYLGDRYGYDGLESTTREALAQLKRVAVPLEVWVMIQHFMQDADLVKFARRAPTEAECAAALGAAEAIIDRTRPVAELPLEPPSPDPAADSEEARP